MSGLRSAVAFPGFARLIRSDGISERVHANSEALPKTSLSTEAAEEAS